MARKRDLSPDLWTDSRVLDLPWPAVAFWVGTISQADDDGRVEWDARQLAARICGTREDVSLADVRSWMAAIERVGLIHTWDADGVTLAHHPRWDRWQSVNRRLPSKLPPPPCVSTHGGLTEDSLSPRCTRARTVRDGTDSVTETHSRADSESARAREGLIVDLAGSRSRFLEAARGDDGEDWAGTFVSAYRRSHGDRPPPHPLIAKVVSAAGALRERDPTLDPADVHAGVRRCAERDKGPALLAEMIGEATNDGTASVPRNPVDAAVDAILARSSP